MAVIVFILAGLGILYVLAVFPLMIAARAKLFPNPVRGQDGHLDSVTAVIPVRNGARWLGRKIESVLAQNYPPHLLEILIVSDGSTDATDQIAESYASRGVKLLRVNAGGKPAAVNAAVPSANGNLLFLTDVRQILQPDCVRRLVAVMADPKVGVVSGDLRITQGTDDEERNTIRYWRYENWIRGNLSRLDSMLGATGPVYMIRRSLYVPIPPDTLLDDVYLPMSVLLAGYRLVHEPRAVAIDEPADLQTEFLRKVRTQAGVVQLFRIFPGLFSSRNRVRVSFVSLKIGRLLLPYLFVLLLISGLSLPSAWRWWAAAPQLAFWALALIDPLFSSGSLIKPFTALPRAFGVLISSAVYAMKVFFVPPRDLWVETRGVNSPTSQEATW